ncbi:hypothetical protein [Tautonia marina]|uniref:hypothetical protein n=1 Tax=Tautonia marina TaxID=2653855 RepID=UPI001260D128|nr:hypothetical protein [Tautonia marina]
MTTTQDQGPTSHSPEAPEPTVTRGQRLRFAAALVVFVAWVAGLALLAIRSDPPPPLSADDRASEPSATAAPDPREG